MLRNSTNLPNLFLVTLLCLAIVGMGWLGWVAYKAWGVISSPPTTQSNDQSYGPATLNVTAPGQKSGSGTAPKSENAPSDPINGSSTSTTPEQKGRPLIILVHGGGWTSGDKASIEHVATDFSEAGFVSLNINYPLATASSPGYPTQQQAVIDAIDWAISKQESLGIDSKRIGLIGGSAGGTLVLQASMLANHKQPGKVKAVAALSPAATDFWATLLLGRSLDSAQREKYFTPIGKVEAYLGCTIDTCSESVAKSASPIYNINANCPVTGLVHSLEEPLPELISQQYDTALRNAGCSSTLTLLGGNLHGFGTWPKIKSGVLDWFKQQL